MASPEPMERWAAMLVKDLNWEELSHALDLGEIHGITAMTGRAMIQVMEDEMARRVKNIMNHYEDDTADAMDQATVEVAADMDSRIKAGITELNVALSLFKDGRISRGVERYQYAMSLFPLELRQ